MHACFADSSPDWDVTAAINAIPGLVGAAYGSGCRRLRLDVSSLETNSSALLAALVLAVACARCHGVELRVAAHASLRSAAALARLDHVLPIQGASGARRGAAMETRI
jgi:anti-anti-sigma regulatory factor